jgi:DNA repair exonuclease SbcCD ATPase subunit
MVRNIDDRVARIEQILPTLATKEDLLATKSDLLATTEDLRAELQRSIQPLATRAEMHEAIRNAVEPLATKIEMREEAERTRRHFDVVAESLRGDIHLIAEGQADLQRRFEDLRGEVKGDIAQLDRRLMRLEAQRNI